MQDLKSFPTIYRYNYKSKVRFWFWGILLFLGLLMFLPWTQNIKAEGKITTPSQDQRPQEINSPIPGKIVKWYVNEGDFVKKGDTILKISEVKEEYLDPNLVNRTQQQVDAKKGAINYYQGKISTSGSQISALNEGRALKISQIDNKINQLENKLKAEKAELSAIKNELELAEDQYNRQQKMFAEGLVSQTQLQERNLKYQNVLSKKIMMDNKLAQTNQEFTNLRLEQNSVSQDYSEKISKAQGDQYESYTQIESGKGEVAKLENKVSNYTIRNGLYIITAPQDGQIVQAKKSGIGEILKEGEQLMVIVPTIKDYAVEMYIDPLDLPLIEVGQKVRFVFDGFPALVFSGWPDGSYGTFGGTIIAYENTISPNGKFRTLVVPDKEDQKWPNQLRIGGGASGIALLKNVPIWYEIWRNINGFPPDYYKTYTKETAIKEK
ncbi:HlyD family secretion protein [Frigoriflavimonas asaccharolytica]|uniref:Multidrug resistance efflux pump n=1 Tax=Frigoriflavimonas asaccharolytica TaxID=2735899 RepID=A0A8J8G6V2_9FLAO|nr:HlyD family efflux transporter periplasmic adaptor subunit [Frigoriflavimonas asaccharolytica]NRS91775.1 multidrug resistance efflux pump [Frigoriflavimonas asaccharolytica]